ncbi:MAG TPA: 5'-nucleotidase C-terminal domain-containing protein [Bacillota bacterium]|nr:5'-nucleotidase C-terminal domain-containing protein [Bacillota bacterium]
MKKKLQVLLTVMLMLLLLVAPSMTGAATAPSAATPTTAATQLVIIHTNDTHGHPLKFNDSGVNNVGGLPARANLVSQARSQYQNLLVLDAGDLNTGRPESNFFKAAPDILGFNYIGYDAMVMGNHEFDNDLGILDKQMTMAKFPFLSANVRRKSDGQYIGQPYIIKEFKGFKVAIFGLTTSEMRTSGNPKVVSDLIIDDEVAVAKKLVPELRKTADVVIALTHMGIYEDDETGSKRLAKYVPGIDLIIDGHTHTKLTEPIYINQTPIVQDWQWGLTVGQGILTLAPQKVKNAKGKLAPKIGVTGFTWGTVALNQKPLGPNDEDPLLLSILEPYGHEVDRLLDVQIGTAGGDFPNGESRKQETAIGDLAADSMYWYFQNQGHPVDFALNNGGGTRADLPKGPISKKTIYAIEPFDNSVVVVTLKGADVQALFDYIAAIPQGDGGFAQVSQGVKYTINYNIGKCENILIGDQPLDPNKQYRIATNSYLAGGGNGYQVFTKAVTKDDTSKFQRDVFIDYISSFGGKSIEPVIYGRITIIGSKLAQILKLLKLAA